MFFPPRKTVLSYFLEPQTEPSPLSPESSPFHSPLHSSTPLPATQPSIVQPPVTTMDIFCDGACIGNGSARARAGFGLYVTLHGARLTEVSEALDRSELHTNQRAELRALERALEFAAESEHKNRIFTDSMYSINCITVWAPQWKAHNWCKTGQKEEIQHKDVITHAYDLWLRVKDRTTIEHVRAHTGKMDYKSLGNKYADELASRSLSLRS
jgi:ribonuclease HI